jgi:hypothetical protein
MKYVKMLGLAAIAAAALMAFVGASSASATVLCNVEGTGSPTGTTCPAGHAYGAGTKIEGANSGVVKLDTTFKTVECNKSTISGEISGEGSATETVTGPEGTLTFTECNCTVNVLKAGKLEIHWISGTHNGTLTSNESEVTVTCSTIFGSVHCIYVTENDSIGDLTASATQTSAAIFHSTAVIKRKATNSLCSEESTWTATYSLSSPKPLYVTGHT